VYPQRGGPDPLRVQALIAHMTQPALSAVVGIVQAGGAESWSSGCSIARAWWKQREAPTSGGPLLAAVGRSVCRTTPMRCPLTRWAAAVPWTGSGPRPRSRPERSCCSGDPSAAALPVKSRGGGPGAPGEHLADAEAGEDRAWRARQGAAGCDGCLLPSRQREDHKTHGRRDDRKATILEPAGIWQGNRSLP
jgi:hypothetical protein